MNFVKTPFSPLERTTVLAITAAFIGCSPPAVPGPVMGAPLPSGVSSDPAAFLQSVPALKGMKKERHRRGNCGGSGCTVKVEIQPYDYPTFDPLTSPAFGHTVAHLSNRDSAHKEARYLLDPHTMADYYVHVSKTANAGAQWALLRVPVGGGPVTNVYQEELRVCHPRTSGSFSADVDFADHKHPPGGPGQICRTASVGTPAINFASIFSLGPLAAFLAQPGMLNRDAFAAAPIWIECGPGCCS